jgi:hypothetical protein
MSRAATPRNMELDDLLDSMEIPAMMNAIEDVFRSMPREMRMAVERPFLKELKSNCDFLVLCRKHIPGLRHQLGDKNVFGKAVGIVASLVAKAGKTDEFREIVEVSASVNGRNSSPKNSRRSAPRPTQPTYYSETSFFDNPLLYVMILWTLMATLRMFVQFAGDDYIASYTGYRPNESLQNGLIDTLLRTIPLPFSGPSITSYIQETSAVKRFTTAIKLASNALTFDKKTTLLGHEGNPVNILLGEGSTELALDQNGTIISPEGSQNYHKTIVEAARSIGADFLAKKPQGDANPKCVPINWQNEGFDFVLGSKNGPTGSLVPDTQYLCFTDDNFNKLPFETRAALVSRPADVVLEDLKGHAANFIGIEKQSSDDRSALAADALFSDSLSKLGYHCLLSVGVGMFFNKYIFGETQIKKLSTSHALQTVAGLYWAARTYSMLSYAFALYATAPSFRTEALLTAGLMWWAPHVVKMVAGAGVAVGGYLFTRKSDGKEGLLSKLVTPFAWGLDLNVQRPMSKFNDDVRNNASKATGKNPSMLSEADLQKQRDKEEAKEREDRANERRRQMALTEKAELDRENAYYRAQQGYQRAIGYKPRTAAAASAALSAVQGDPGDEIEAAARLLLSSGMFF